MNCKKMAKKKKKWDGMVYSTNPNYDLNANEQTANVSKSNQNLKVWYEKRNGKPSTIVRDFVGPDSELKELGKDLKKLCSCGGSVKDGEIILQGDSRDKVVAYLQGLGCKVKKAGG